MRLGGDEMRKLKYPPLERKWFKCPHCNTKLAVVDNTAKSNGVFIKCRVCKNEIEIKI